MVPADDLGVRPLLGQPRLPIGPSRDAGLPDESPRVLSSNSNFDFAVDSRLLTEADFA